MADVVAVVDQRLHDQRALPGDLGAAQAADQLLALAAEHRAADDLEPAAGVGLRPDHAAGDYRGHQTNTSDSRSTKPSRRYRRFAASRWRMRRQVERRGAGRVARSRAPRASSASPTPLAARGLVDDDVLDPAAQRRSGRGRGPASASRRSPSSSRATSSVVPGDDAISASSLEGRPGACGRELRQRAGRSPRASSSVGSVTRSIFT